MRHRKPPPPRRRRAFTTVGAVAVVAVAATVGYGGFEYVSLDRGLTRSDVMQQVHGDTTPLTDDVNMLVMGLDSRLDLEGRPLPQEMYEAMHTGNSSIGGMNTNVLMFVHIPADGRPATVIQIPRDDDVDFPDCPYQVCKGKIKEAYNYAFAAADDQLQGRDDLSAQEKHRKARDAGRAQEIRTVEAFLGSNVRIDQWVEVTMVAFYQLAQAVQPITVCLKQDTTDSKSGADFKAGKQEISAEQAMAFVRQRRDDSGDAAFTDLDRERRQQAFIASLAAQLRQKGTFTDPGKVNSLIGVAKSNIAVDERLNLIDLAGKATQLASGKVTFYTLPIVGSHINHEGAWVNDVDLPAVQGMVQQLLRGERPSKSASSSGAASPTAEVPSEESSAAGADRADRSGGGHAAAAEGTATADSAGSSDSGLSSDEGATTGADVAPAPVETVGTGGAHEDTSTSTLTAISGGGVPCVK